MASWTIIGSTTSSYYWKARIIATEISQNAANNTTELSVVFQLGRDVSSSYIITSNTKWYLNVGEDESGEKTLASFTWDPANAGTWKDIATRTVTVQHDPDGSKTLNISAKWYDTNAIPSSASVVGEIRLSNISRGTVPQLPNDIELGDKLTITLPRESSSFVHELSYRFGAESGNISNLKYDTSATWTIPLSFANQIPNTILGNGSITCKTYNGQELIGTSTVNFVAKVPDSIVPAVSSINDNDDVGLKQQFNAYVQRASRLKVDIVATGNYGSTISKIQTEVQGTVYSGNYFLVNELTQTGTVPIKTTVTDSRGRTASRTTSISVLPYNYPHASFSATRTNQVGEESPSGEYLGYDLSYEISPLNNRNDALYRIEYKTASTETWTTLIEGTEYSQNIVDAVSSTPVVSGDEAYNVRLYLKDSITSLYVYASDLPTSVTVFDIHSSGNGMAFGKVAEEDLFEVNWDTRLNKNVDIYNDILNVYGVLTGGYGQLSKIGDVISGTELSKNMTNGWTNNYSVNLTTGVWLLIGTITAAHRGYGFTIRIAKDTSSSTSYIRQSVYCPDGNLYTGQVVYPVIIVVGDAQTYYLQTWTSSGATFDTGELRALRLS